jgi:hypothetical protein
MSLRKITTGLFATVVLFAADFRDPKAVEIAHAMQQAMGGQDAWNAARFIRFDFKVKIGGETKVGRSHLWDKQTGRYRLDQKDRVVLNKQGTVYVESKKLEGPTAAKAIEDAYAAYINDFYWLAMPWKWLEEGVRLKYFGKKPHGGENCDVVELTFGKVGLTPGDRYQAFVSPKTHLMTYWEYSLQSGNKGSWDWQYGDFDGVKLANNHTSPPDKSINMGVVRISKDVDSGYFNDPLRRL